MKQVNLNVLNGINGFTIHGYQSEGYAGTSVSNSGDINKDGVYDIVIGAPQVNYNHIGQIYIIFGSSSSFNVSFNLNALNGTNGFTINGYQSEGYAGTSVSNAGDTNDDGVQDILIGAPQVGYNHVGQSYVVFGERPIPPSQQSVTEDFHAVAIALGVCGGVVVASLLGVGGYFYYKHTHSHPSGMGEEELASLM